MSLQKTITVSQQTFSTLPGRGVSKSPDYYKGQVMAMLSEMGATSYGIDEGDIVFLLEIASADGVERKVKFRIRPVLIQVETKRGRNKELKPRPDTSWYLLWKLLESKIAAIKVGIVEAHHEMMQYIQLTDNSNQPVQFSDVIDWLIKTDRLDNTLQLEDQR